MGGKGVGSLGMAGPTPDILIVGTVPTRLTLAHVSKSHIIEYTWIKN